jgi:hypothetical protein
MKTRTAYRVMMFANATYLRQTYGDAFYRSFRSAADDKRQELIPRIPDLGDSVASMSCAFITAYVPFLYAFKQFDETRDRAGELLWVMNENLLTCFPSAIRTLLGRMATSKTMLKSIRAAQLQAKRGLLHPMDWRVVLEEPAEGGHRTTWTQCGALRALRARMYVGSLARMLAISTTVPASVRDDRHAIAVLHRQQMSRRADSRLCVAEQSDLPHTCRVMSPMTASAGRTAPCTDSQRH